MRDLLSTVELMTDEEAGKLLKAIIDCVDGKPVSLNREILFAFTPIKNQLERDCKKYDDFVEKQRLNGKKGGRPANPKNPSLPKPTQANPKNLDTVNDNDNDTVTDNNKTPSQKYKYSDEDDSLARYIHRAILVMAPNAKPPNFPSWANTIRLMRESDKIPISEIRRIFDWANKDSFWSANILSPAKLREKFTDLSIKSSRGRNETFNKQSKSARVASKLDEIAAKDIRENGFTHSLDN